MQAYLRLTKDRGGVLVRLTDRSARHKVIKLLEKKRIKEAFDVFRSQAEVLLYVPPDAPSPSGAWINLQEDQV